MKQVLVLGVGLALLFLHQNCGSLKPQENEPGSGASVGIIDPGTQSVSQSSILAQVMDGYGACERSGAQGSEWTRCQRGVIEAAQMRDLPQPTGASEGAQKAPFCYVFGPQCRQQTAGLSPAQIVQTCRSYLKETGFADDVLTSLAKMDPVGYAVLINNECLYKKYACVIAVKCS